MSNKRKISKEFLHDLKNENGILYPIVERVRCDHTLMLAIRENYINIYYRGGNLIKIKELQKHRYATSFEEKYFLGKAANSITYPDILATKIHSLFCVENFKNVKEAMDIYFSEKPKLEREFQQLIVRENNFSNESQVKQTDYFIIDIEVNDKKEKETAEEKDTFARADILAIKWEPPRTSFNKCVPVLMEVKFGSNAYKDSSGIIDHLVNMNNFLKNYDDLIETIEYQLSILYQLKLINYDPSAFNSEIKLNKNHQPSFKPEIIFILANHNPGNKALKDIINDKEIEKFNTSNNYDLKFYVSNFAGYGLYQSSMLTLDEFRILLNNR